MPHTKQKIQQLLVSAGINPRHRWGQNFLIDLNIMRLLVRTADLKGNEVVLEVGCGTGSLTDLLAEQAGFVIGVEIDAALQDIVSRELADRSNFELIAGDVLVNKNTIDPRIYTSLSRAKQQTSGPFYLIANLPYQVAAALIINLLLSETPDAMFITVQNEVGMRMNARPGEKAYGILSILLQASGKVERLRRISPQSFWPAPRVTSVMMSWRRYSTTTCSLQDLIKLKYLGEILLGKRRKKIKTCLQAHEFGNAISPLLDQLGISLDMRGETISPEQFLRLARLCPDNIFRE